MLPNKVRASQCLSGARPCAQGWPLPTLAGAPKKRTTDHLCLFVLGCDSQGKARCPQLSSLKSVLFKKAGHSLTQCPTVERWDGLRRAMGVMRLLCCDLLRSTDPSYSYRREEDDNWVRCGDHGYILINILIRCSPGRGVLAQPGEPSTARFFIPPRREADAVLCCAHACSPECQVPCANSDPTPANTE
jgi:hypothetical protein